MTLPSHISNLVLLNAQLSIGLPITPRKIVYDQTAFNKVFDDNIFKIKVLIYVIWPDSIFKKLSQLPRNSL